MKKWTVALLTVILALGITACGDKDANGGKAAEKPAVTETANKEEKQEPKQEEKPADSAEPTADQLLTKAAEATKLLKSFAMESVIDQNITVKQGDQKQEQKVGITLKSEMINEPMSMFIDMKMSLPGQEQVIKTYVTKDGSYVSTDGKSWNKIPGESVDQMMAEMKGQASPDKQLEQFKQIAKDMKVTEEGDQYVLTADLSGDGLKEFAKAMVSQSGNPQSAAMLDQMNIKSIKVVTTVNKETFLPAKYDLDMVMEMEQEGQGMSMNMVMKSTISKHNEIKEIKVPEEVTKSAK